MSGTVLGRLVRALREFSTFIVWLKVFEHNLLQYLALFRLRCGLQDRKLSLEPPETACKTRAQLYERKPKPREPALESIPTAVLAVAPVRVPLARKYDNRAFGAQAALNTLKPLFEKRQQQLLAMSSSDGVLGPGLALLSSRRRKLHTLKRKVAWVFQECLNLLSCQPIICHVRTHLVPAFSTSHCFGLRRRLAQSSPSTRPVKWSLERTMGTLAGRMGPPGLRRRLSERNTRST